MPHIARAGAGPDPVGGTRDIRPCHRWAPGHGDDLCTCRAMPGRRPTGAESLDGITLRDRTNRENARRAADLRGLWLYRRWPLRCADLVSLARGQSPAGGPGSGVVVFVPQLVSKAARRGDRLDGEAVFEAA